MRSTRTAERPAGRFISNCESINSKCHSPWCPAPRSCLRASLRASLAPPSGCKAPNLALSTEELRPRVRARRAWPPLAQLVLRRPVRRGRGPVHPPGRAGVGGAGRGAALAIADVGEHLGAERRARRLARGRLCGAREWEVRGVGLEREPARPAEPDWSIESDAVDRLLLGRLSCASGGSPALRPALMRFRWFACT